MRFMTNGQWKSNDLSRLVVLLFLLFVLLFWLTNFLLFYSHMSFSYEAIVAHYLGKEDAWGGMAVPRSYKVLLEVSHMHLFAIGILLLTVTHLLLFAPGSARAKAWIAIAVFSSALVNEGSGWLIRYVHPGFAYLKLGMFLLFQVSLGAIVVLLGRSLWGKWMAGHPRAEAP